jgi:fumarate hydratase class II
VLGHDVAIGIAASQGQFELNTCKPLIAANLLDSLRLLTDAMDSFTRHCVVGLEALRERLGEQLDRSLMTVTALTPHIGYERAAAIARHAHQQGLNLREAAAAVGGLSAVEFDAWVQVGQMLGPAG